MDFNYLVQFGNEAVKRFETLVRNVKAKSNSFYDSYLDLLETVLESALLSADYPVPDKNAGYLLHGYESKECLTQVYGVEPQLIEKLHDHVLKANKHKHQKERNVDLNSVLAFMEPFYVFSHLCAHLDASGDNSFDPQYFVPIFGALEKENSELRKQIDALYQKVEHMARQHEITGEELAACRVAVQSLDDEKADLEVENAEMKEAIIMLQGVTMRRVEDLERKYEKLDKKQEEIDEKVARILNGFSQQPQQKEPASAPIPKKAIAPNDDREVMEFFQKAKVYFSDSANGPVNRAEARMMRRGIFCGLAGIVTFIVSLFLLDAYRLFSIVGALMLAYGVLMVVIVAKVTGFEMQDPEEFWCFAQGKATYNGRGVDARFFPAKWKWLTSLLFLLSLGGIFGLLFAASPLVLKQPPSLAASLAIIQGVVSIVSLILCITVTGRSYQFQYVIFQVKDDVVRYDRLTGQWSTRDKRYKDYRI